MFLKFLSEEVAHKQGTPAAEEEERRRSSSRSRSSRSHRSRSVLDRMLQLLLALIFVLQFEGKSVFFRVISAAVTSPLWLHRIVFIQSESCLQVFCVFFSFQPTPVKNSFLCIKHPDRPSA